MRFDPQNIILKKIGNAADESGFRIFVVGGYVRDLILGVIDNDIDIMVLGDGIQFAELIAEKFKKPLDAVYKNFSTALLNIDGYNIEFASARKESYNRSSRKP